MMVSGRVIDTPTYQKTFAVSATDLSLSRGQAFLFAGLTLSVGPGELLWVNGGNGLGKTSLLRLLAGFARADTGTISWSRDNGPCQARDIIGFQGHHDAFKPTLITSEALRFWADVLDVPDISAQVLDQVGLGARHDVACGQLSAGQKRRLALARLILSQKPVWIMDEPTAAMDSKGVALIHSLVESHISAGGSAIIASHDRAQTMAATTRRLTLQVAA